MPHDRAATRNLIWVSTIAPANSLDSATWLDTARELETLGWSVQLIVKGRLGRRTDEGVELVKFPHPSIYFIGQWVFHLQVLRFLIREWGRFDVLLFHQISALWLLPLRVVRRLRSERYPVLIMDTRDLPDPAPGSLRIRVRLLHYRLIYWIADCWADSETTITQRMAALVGVREEKLAGVWPSGVNPEMFTRSLAMRSWPKADDPVQLIYIGRLLRNRHLRELCRVVGQANARGMNFGLSLVGDGPDKEAIAEYARRPDGRIRLMAPVPHVQIPKLLTYAHVGVTSLPDSEEAKYEASSPVKLFEYMAAGMPILSTRNACHTDVVGDGPYAFWADEPNETALLRALNKIWIQRGSLHRLGNAADRASAAWTWHASATKLSQALESAISSV